MGLVYFPRFTLQKTNHANGMGLGIDAILGWYFGRVISSKTIVLNFW